MEDLNRGWYFSNNMQPFSDDTHAEVSSNDYQTDEEVINALPGVNEENEANGSNYTYQTESLSHFQITVSLQDQESIHKEQTMSTIIIKRLTIKLQSTETELKAVSPATLFLKTFLAGKILTILKRHM